PQLPSRQTAPGPQDAPFGCGRVPGTQLAVPPWQRVEPARHGISALVQATPSTQALPGLPLPSAAVPPPPSATGAALSSRAWAQPNAAAPRRTRASRGLREPARDATLRCKPLV